MNNQYKVGDKVRVIGNKHGHEFPIGEIVELTEQVNSERKSWRAQGKSNPRYASVRFWCITEDEFEPVTFPDEIHITVKGNKTIAVHKSNGKLVKRAEAICCPSDEFNFNVGAKLAMDRIFEDKPKEPRFKVGDKVKFRSWDSMEKEFGTNSGGAINCKYHFGTNMKHLCGAAATVNGVDGERVYLKDISAHGDVCWSYSTDMLEPYTEPEQKEPIARLYCVEDFEDNVGHVANKGKIYSIGSDGYITFENDMKSWFEYKSFEDMCNKKPKLQIRSHFAPLISRPAKVDEWIIPINGDGHSAKLNVPHKVTEEDPDGAYVSASDLLLHSQYLVLDGYQPKEPFKPYLECSGVNYGIIGEETDTTACGGIQLKNGDVAKLISICTGDVYECMVFTTSQGSVGLSGWGKLDDGLKNGKFHFCSNEYIVYLDRDYTELKDGEVINGVTAHLTEKGE